MANATLRPTRDPDVATVRAWDLKYYVIGGVTAAIAVVLGLVVRPQAGVVLLVVSVFCGLIVSRRAVVSRRTATFDVRFPWTSNQAPTRQPITPGDIRVRRVRSTARHSIETSCSITVRDIDLATGLGGDEAEALAAELRTFLSEGPAGQA